MWLGLLDIIADTLGVLGVIVVLVYAVAIFVDILVESKQALALFAACTLVTVLLCLAAPTFSIFFAILGPAAIHLFIYSKSRQNLSTSHKFYTGGSVAVLIGTLHAFLT